MGGFFVKFEIFYSLINSSQYFIAYILFILTVFSFFYYLRLIKIIYFEENKTIKKNKNLDDIKLRLISLLIFSTSSKIKSGYSHGAHDGSASGQWRKA